ncbi:MAG TPA: FKBP-type peptidyl-prolyl cis-trans isomerase [Urbifossiella sp.]|jgi:peptidylprolyl isomerase|nr:FKBP-type peptidyl-prolyl cis-trans isomerase [Urbifossiella sp.]
MSRPNPPRPAAAGGKKPWSPGVLLAGAGLVVAAVAAVAYFGGPRPALSDGSDATAPDPDLKDLTAGVKYRDLKDGTGEPCGFGAAVRVRYTGWLPDGTVFDAGPGRGKAADVGLDGPKVIAGWQEGIPGMKKGGVRKLVVPPEMGYGEQKKEKVPPNSTLIYEIELLGFSGGEDPAGRRGPPALFDGTAPGADDPGLKDIGGGLLVRDLTVGTGPTCEPGATIMAEYTGWLPTGAIFDTSLTRGEPGTRGEPSRFPLRGVIDGWQKGIPGMKVGGIRKLVVPPGLGYGPARKGLIPRNSTLVFEIELLGVE